MQDPYWLTGPPRDRVRIVVPEPELTVEPRLDAKRDPVAADQSHLPKLRVPVLGLLWLPAAFWFKAGSTESGLFFLLAILWVFTYPIVAVFFVGATVMQIRKFTAGEFGDRASRARLGVWVVCAVLYVGLLLTYIVLSVRDVGSN